MRLDYGYRQCDRVRLTVAGWVLRVLAWVFAVLFIAGFTGAVRKT